MTHIVYIGVDDTDIIGSVGTGKVARGLAERLMGLGLGESLGVSRHQLLVDSRIKYTSHNSAKGIALMTERDVTEFYDPSIEYMKDSFQAGSDPGLCICDEAGVDEEIKEFGRNAISAVLTKENALGLAERRDVFLKELGGDGGGVIGALAAVGLRAWGNEGRLVDLPGIHEIKGIITVADLLARTPIESVEMIDGTPLGAGEIIDSLDWIRPSLLRGHPVLRVTAGTDASGNRVWLSIEKRNRSAGGED